MVISRNWGFVDQKVEIALSGMREGVDKCFWRSLRLLD